MRQHDDFANCTVDLSRSMARKLDASRHIFQTSCNSHDHLGEGQALEAVPVLLEVAGAVAHGVRVLAQDAGAALAVGRGGSKGLDLGHARVHWADDVRRLRPQWSLSPINCDPHPFPARCTCRAMRCDIRFQSDQTNLMHDTHRRGEAAALVVDGPRRVARSDVA